LTAQALRPAAEHLGGKGLDIAPRDPGLPEPGIDVARRDIEGTTARSALTFPCQPASALRGGSRGAITLAVKIAAMVAS
jgi:hypothetical protein